MLVYEQLEPKERGRLSMPSKRHSREQIISKLLVARLRQQWPEVMILVRGDSGFAMPALYDWCEAQDVPVRYLIGLAQNPRLRALAEPHLQAARARFKRTAEKVRQLHDAAHAADSWSQERRILFKAEVAEKGDNPRFVVTNLRGAGPVPLVRSQRRDGKPHQGTQVRFADGPHQLSPVRGQPVSGAAACGGFPAVHGPADGAGRNRTGGGAGFTLQRRLLKLGVRVKETARRVWLQFVLNCPLQSLRPVVLA